MEYDLLSATQRDEIITKHLREFLPPLGLAEITPRTWVDGSQPPVRRIFELSLLKGAAVKACWGFSLDFVPHISGGKVRWHGSDKTARLDVIVDLKICLSQVIFTIRDVLRLISANYCLKPYPKPKNFGKEARRITECSALSGRFVSTISTASITAIIPSYLSPLHFFPR